MSDSSTRAPRYNIGDMKVIYDTGDSFWIGPVVNLSESGIFVETHHELPPGTRVTLLPEGPGDEPLPFEVQAEVVRVNAFNLDEHWDRTPGLAFQMVDMSPEHVQQFRDYLARYGVPVL